MSYVLPLCCNSCKNSLQGGRHGTRAVAPQVCGDLYYGCMTHMPDFTLLCCCKKLCLVEVTVQEQSHLKFVWTLQFLSPVCCDTRVCAYVRAGLCVDVLEPRVAIQLFFPLLAAAVAVSCCLYHTASQGLKLSTFVAATVQQQSHGKFVRTTTYLLYVCAVCAMSVCVKVCAGQWM